jgi:ribosomal-protein-alanine N-acetyltransferase
VTAWRIEPLTLLDELDAVLAIEEASFTNPWTREMYLSELDRTDASAVYLARASQGEIVGFCSFWRVLDELHINNLAVAPDRRRAGVASALLRSVLAEGARRGARSVLLEVRRSNDAARELYSRMGFSVVAVRHGYYSHPEEDALVLRRDGLSEEAHTPPA